MAGTAPFRIGKNRPGSHPLEELHPGAQVSLKMFRALTVYNMAFQYQDKEQQAQLQGLALEQLSQLTKELQQATNR